MYAVDLHSHSRFFHGFEGESTAFDPVGARMLTAVAARRGMDAVALTNHDYRWLPSGHRFAEWDSDGGTGGGAARGDGPTMPASGATDPDHATSDPDPFEANGGTDPADTATTDPVGTETTDPAGTETADPTDTETTDPAATATSDPAPATAADPERGPPAGDRPVALPGIEITTTRGHLLVVGPDPPARTEPGTLSPDEAIDLAHDRDCAAIIPHPFRASTVRETDATVDAVEVNGKHTHHRERVALLAEERGCPIVGGSDAHYPFEVARAYTRVEADELTPESVVEAIRDGRVEPAVRRYRLDRLLTPAYRLIHRLKGHLPVEDSSTT